MYLPTLFWSAIKRISIALLFISFSVWSIAQNKPAKIKILINDGTTEKPTSARVKMIDSHGHIAPLPSEAIGIMYGRDDRAEGFTYQPDSAFYVNGSFSLSLDPGSYRMTISKGFEFVQQQVELNITSGQELSKTITLKRWVNMPEKGWYSTDDHIHIRRSPRENPYILQWLAAEDVHVGALLQMGDFWATYYSQYDFGQDGVYQEEDYMLTAGQEDPRTHEVGHTIILGAEDDIRYRNQYYLYDMFFDKAHELNGVTGYAHQGMSFNGSRGMTIDVLRRKIDFLELLQFCVPEGPIHLDNYYRFLDLGYKLTATAGSDFPWCGVGEGWNSQIGNARFYTYIDGPFSFENWKKSLKAGHTFVSSGPMLDFKVEGLLPGDSLNLKKKKKVTITATARGHQKQIPLEYLEIVAHGKVIASIKPSDDNQSPSELHLEMELPIDHGVWVAARAGALNHQLAHTTPVYITLNGDGFHNPESAPAYLDASEKFLQELEAEIAQRNERVNFNAWRYQEDLQKRIDEAREIIEELSGKLK